MENLTGCGSLQMESWVQEMKLELKDLRRIKSKQYNFDFETCAPNIDGRCKIRWIDEERGFDKLNNSFSNHQDMQKSYICSETTQTQ